jgi:hypothetical protein
MVFVELTPFFAFRDAHWSDEDLRKLQEFLLATQTQATSSRAVPVCASCVGLSEDAASEVARG